MILNIEVDPGNEDKTIYIPTEFEYEYEQWQKKHRVTFDGEECILDLDQALVELSVIFGDLKLIVYVRPDDITFLDGYYLENGQVTHFLSRYGETIIVPTLLGGTKEIGIYYGSGVEDEGYGDEIFNEHRFDDMFSEFNITIDTGGDLILPRPTVPNLPN